MSGGRGGKARGRPTRVECDTARRVVPSGARLVACPAGGASATVVPDLHLEAVGPTVPGLVPGWFFGCPMGWAAGRGFAAGCATTIDSTRLLQKIGVCTEEP